MDDIKLKKGLIKIDNSLTILDDIKKNNRLVKIILIVAILSLLSNGYSLYLNFSITLAVITLIILIWGLIASYLLYINSNEVIVYFDEIKNVKIKKRWINKLVIQLDLTDGKRRFISNFKNDEDVKQLYKYIKDNIISKS